MTASHDTTLELLAWIDRRPRTYLEAMEAWQSHCPRSTPWEDALVGSLIAVERTNGNGSGTLVTLTALGREALAAA